MDEGSEADVVEVRGFIGQPKGTLGFTGSMGRQTRKGFAAMNYSDDDKTMSELERKYIEQTCVKILRETDDRDQPSLRYGSARMAADPRDEQDRVWKLVEQYSRS